MYFVFQSTFKFKIFQMQTQITSQRKSPAKPVLIGAGIGLLLISIFLLGVNNPDPSWPKLWMLRPLAIVPMAGAAGGFFYYLMNPLRRKGGWNAILANVLSILVFIIGLWMGSILGLDGTLWD